MKKDNPNETNTTKSPVEPKLNKPRTDEDDDGQDIVATNIATALVLSENPSVDLSSDATAWSGQIPESEMKRRMREVASQHDAITGVGYRLLCGVAEYAAFVQGATRVGPSPTTPR